MTVTVTWSVALAAPWLSVTVNWNVRSSETFGAVNVGLAAVVSLRVTVAPAVCVQA
ncbi:MAG: hypothetical protein OXI33_03900 [Chloroflexota bacterium]|nr:hypothetical protein [Chloroflexota bacterium]